MSLHDSLLAEYRERLSILDSLFGRLIDEKQGLLEENRSLRAETQDLHEQVATGIEREDDLQISLALCAPPGLY